MVWWFLNSDEFLVEMEISRANSFVQVVCNTLCYVVGFFIFLYLFIYLFFVCDVDTSRFVGI